MVEKLALDPFMKSQIHLFFKHQTNKWWYFSEQGWGKFQFGKNFLRRESPTLKQRKNQGSTCHSYLFRNLSCSKTNTRRIFTRFITLISFTFYSEQDFRFIAHKKRNILQETNYRWGLFTKTKWYKTKVCELFLTLMKT